MNGIRILFIYVEGFGSAVSTPQISTVYSQCPSFSHLSAWYYAYEWENWNLSHLYFIFLSDLSLFMPIFKSWDEIYAGLGVNFMLLILDGNSDHVAREKRKSGIFFNKRNIYMWLLSILTNALNISNKRNSSIRAHLFLNCHLLWVPWSIY